MNLDRMIDELLPECRVSVNAMMEHYEGLDDKQAIEAWYVKRDMLAMASIISSIYQLIEVERGLRSDAEAHLHVLQQQAKHYMEPDQSYVKPKGKPFMKFADWQRAQTNNSVMEDNYAVLNYRTFDPQDERTLYEDPAPAETSTDWSSSTDSSWSSSDSSSSSDSGSSDSGSGGIGD